MLTLKVFLSSPGDVAEERRLAIETLNALEAGPLLRDRVNLTVVAWDDPLGGAPLDAGGTAQLSVNRWAGRPADCDLTIVILWSRLGTPLPAGLRRADGSRYASGTVWEVEDAIAADRPVFVYRRTEKPQIELDDPAFDARRAQYQAVRDWFESLRDADGAWRAGINEYGAPAQFQQMLRAHLESFIVHRLAGHGDPATASAMPQASTPWMKPAWTVSASAASNVSASPAFKGRPWDEARPSSSARRPARLLLMTTVALGLAGVALAWLLGRTPDASTTAAPPASTVTGAAAPAPPSAAPGVATAPARLPQVRLSGPASVEFTAHRPSTYTVLALTPEAGTPDEWQLRFSLRLTTAPNSGGMNFWSSSFRLVIDGVPRAPTSRLNEIVESGASKDGDVTFDVPWGVQTLALRVSHYAKVAELPLAVSGTGPPKPRHLPPGPRQVTLDGPAELRFTKAPPTIYTVLEVGSEPRRPGVFELRVWMRKHVLEGNANFWDAQFRLLVDGVPREPDSNLNEVVEGGSAKDRDITFEVPDGAQQLVLRVMHTAEQAADVPIRFQRKP